MNYMNIPNTRLKSWTERLQSGQLKTVRDRIVKYLYDCQCERSYNEISKDLDIKPQSLTQPLKKLSDQGVLLRDREKVCSISGYDCIAYRLAPEISDALVFTDN
jgi:predicted transcriptional regulator